MRTPEQCLRYFFLIVPLRGDRVVPFIADIQMEPVIIPARRLHDLSTIHVNMHPVGE